MIIHLLHRRNFSNFILLQLADYITLMKNKIMRKIYKNENVQVRFISK